MQCEYLRGLLRHSILRKVAGLAVSMALSGCQNMKELRCFCLLQKAGEELILHLLNAIPYFLGFVGGVGRVSQWFRAFRHAARVKCKSSGILPCALSSSAVVAWRTWGKIPTVNMWSLAPSGIIKFVFLGHQTWLEYFDLCSEKLVTASELCYSCCHCSCCSELLSPDQAQQAGSSCSAVALPIINQGEQEGGREKGWGEGGPGHRQDSFLGSRN